MIKKNIIMLSVLMMAFSHKLLAQQATNNTVEMADAMIANGKIYVVVGVITIVFICIVTYLIMLDRKISKLEKNIQK